MSENERRVNPLMEIVLAAARQRQEAVKHTLISLHGALWVLAQREPSKQIQFSKAEMEAYQKRFPGVTGNVEETPYNIPRVRMDDNPDGGVTLVQDQLDAEPEGNRAEPPLGGRSPFRGATERVNNQGPEIPTTPRVS